MEEESAQSLMLRPIVGVKLASPVGFRGAPIGQDDAASTGGREREERCTGIIGLVALTMGAQTYQDRRLCVVVFGMFYG